jgi:hypothetical protein
MEERSESCDQRRSAFAGAGLQIHNLRRSLDGLLLCTRVVVVFGEVAFTYSNLWFEPRFLLLQSLERMASRALPARVQASAGLAASRLQRSVLCAGLVPFQFR